jgi:hypothetical protein
MSLPAAIAPAIMDTVIARLAPLFLTGASGDAAAAREAATQMLAAHHPETPDELSLAADIISLQLHTLESLSYAADPDLSLNKTLRLRGSAVSLSRESHKAQRKLDQLQNARRAGLSAPTQSPQAPTPSRIDDALGLIDAAREAIETAGKSDRKTWSQALQKRLTAQRMAEKMKKNQAEYARLHPPAAGPQPATAACTNPR